MPAPASELIVVAASVILEVWRGSRASAELGRAIAARSLRAEQAEGLSGLVYATLRRELRLRAGFAELRVPVAQEDESARLLVIAAGLLEGSIDTEAARAAWSELPWQRFLTADAALLARVSGAERVALLGSLPSFLAELLFAQYGAEADALAQSLSEPAPRALRVNGLVRDVAQATEELAAEGARTRRGSYGKRTLVLEGAFNPFTTRAFHAGAFELQDEGSQICCELVAPPPRGLVVDACAGAGGKSLAVAAALAGRGKVVSLDVDAGKLAELRRRAKRAGAANIQPITIEAEGPLPQAVQALTGKVERILIDAPCSGTGVLRRNPEARARLSPEAIERLVATQREIVERMLPLLAAGGRLVFATCSLLRAEGEDLLDAVQAAHPELSPVNLAEIYDRAYVDRFVRPAPHQLRLLPHLHGTDGFFVGVLRRTRS